MWFCVQTTNYYLNSVISTKSYGPSQFIVRWKFCLWTRYKQGQRTQVITINQFPTCPCHLSLLYHHFFKLHLLSQDGLLWPAEGKENKSNDFWVHISVQPWNGLPLYYSTTLLGSRVTLIDNNKGKYTWRLEHLTTASAPNSYSFKWYSWSYILC